LSLCLPGADDRTRLHTPVATAIHACSTIQCTRTSQRSRRRSGSSIRVRSNLVRPIGSLAYRRCHPGSRPGLKFWVEDGIFMAHGELGVPFAVWHIVSCIMASKKPSALHRQPNPAASQRAAMPNCLAASDYPRERDLRDWSALHVSGRHSKQLQLARDAAFGRLGKSE